MRLPTPFGLAGKRALTPGCAGGGSAPYPPTQGLASTNLASTDLHAVALADRR